MSGSIRFSHEIGRYVRTFALKKKFKFLNYRFDRFSFVVIFCLMLLTRSFVEMRFLIMSVTNQHQRFIIV